MNPPIRHPRTVHRSCRPRQGFTLIEILIACLLVGVGLSAVVGVVFAAILQAQRASAWYTVAPIAHSALDYAIGTGRITTTDHSESTPMPGFSCPYSIVIDDQMPPGFTAPADTSHTLGTLKTFRVRVFDTEEDLAAAEKVAAKTKSEERLIFAVPSEPLPLRNPYSCRPVHP